MTPLFRKRYFPQATAAQWRDWHWQLSNAFRSQGQLERVVTLSEGEKAGFTSGGRAFPLSITPHYLSLMDLSNPEDPLRRTMIPRAEEHLHSAGERSDPLGEEAHTPVPRIVHTYPSKVLFLVTDFCATYCRYCTRARSVGSGAWKTSPAEWEPALQYIEAHEEIRDVLISGGDPLTLADERIEMLLARLHAIPHVKLLRIGSKIPAVLPQRITPALVRMLKRYHPLYISIHFTHPNELCPDVRTACQRLVNAGIPLGGQMVLLKGVNDSSETMRALCEGLLECRVKPYYLHQCDPIIGSAHFKTSVKAGQDIIRSLHGHTTGYAVPMYMIDAPGGGGKVPVGPDYIEGREGDDLLLRNYRGDIYRYHDPL